MSTLVRSIVGGAVVIALAAVFYFWLQAPEYVFIPDSSDTIASWEYPSSFRDGGAIEAKTRAEITERLSRVGGEKDEAGEPSDYSLYVGIAARYELLGDGKSAYDYLNKALAIDAEKTGLAWHNMGVLMARLGANESAAIAYRHAVTAQPQISLYHVNRIEFLIERFAKDPPRIESALSEALSALPENPSILQLKARYDKGV